MASGRLRRLGPVLLVVAALVWIIIIVVWIAVSPEAGTGNPMG